MQGPRFELGEIDVEHHHNEQEQHGDGADIDHDQDHRQELGAEQHEEPGGVEEGEDKEQHRVHGIARGDDHEGRGEQDRRQRDRRTALHSIIDLAAGGHR